MKNNHRYRILNRPGDEYPYIVQKHTFFFWSDKTMHQSEIRAHEQIVEYLRKAHANSKPRVVAEYSSEDYLADKLRGI